MLIFLEHHHGIILTFFVCLVCVFVLLGLDSVYLQNLYICMYMLINNILFDFINLTHDGVGGLLLAKYKRRPSQQASPSVAIKEEMQSQADNTTRSAVYTQSAVAETFGPVVANQCQQVQTGICVAF